MINTYGGNFSLQDSNNNVKEVGVLEVLQRKNITPDWIEWKAKKLQAITKCFLKYKAQGKLMTHFSDFSMLSTNKIQ